MIAKSMTTRQRHAEADRGLDLYETPPEAVHALMRAERLPYSIWEASCGRGAIVRVLRAAGHEVLATDLEDYRSVDQDLAGVDFMLQRQLPYPTIEAILQNPPFGRAAEFVERSLELCPRVYILARLGFLEGGYEKTAAGRARIQVLDGGMLARVHIFQNRLPMMHRDGWKGPRSTNTIAFAWYVFDRYHVGPTALYRIRWEPVLSLK